MQHQGSGRLVVLPRDYVATSAELGYAYTIHCAQGVSVDTMHGVATGTETRQQFYTMMTRGRHTNHVWLEVVADGLRLPETVAFGVAKQYRLNIRNGIVCAWCTDGG